ncbi:MAG: hypothetical protein IAF94_24830 [Pirellulaceae bacterium]|nr:hypothetical protein [Pirellulaceae bacterium]
MQRSTTYALFVGSILFLLCNASAQEDANEVIRQLERGFLPAHSVRLKLRAVGYRKGGLHKKEVRFASMDADVLRDGDKWRIKGEQAAVRFRNETGTEYRGTLEYLVTSDHLANVEWLDGEPSNAPHTFSATYEATALQKESGVITLLHGYLLFGFSPNHGNKKLVDVIRSASALGRAKITSQGNETVVQMSDEQGQQSIAMISVNNRLLPVKVDILKGTLDSLGGKKVGELTGGGENPAGKMVAFEQHIGPIKWDNEHKFIESYEVRSIRKYHPGGDIEERAVVTVLESHTPSEKELGQFVIQSTIPNGTPVNVREMQHIAHEWRDGKIQKVLDMSSVEKMSDTRFEQPAAPLFNLSRVVIGLSIVLGLASIGWLLYRRTRPS